jgi:hypothetical protein
MANCEQFKYHSDEIAAVIRSSANEVFLIRIEARPEPGSKDHGIAAGAIVNCWVAAETLRDAERSAVASIRDNSWLPEKLDSWEIVARDQYFGWEPTDHDDQDPRELIQRAIAGERYASSSAGPLVLRTQKGSLDRSGETLKIPIRE